MGHPRRQLSTFGVVVLGLLTVAAVLWGGTTRFGTARWFTTAPQARRPAAPSPSASAHALRHPHPQSAGWLLVALAVAAAMVLVWLVVRSVLRARERRRWAPPLAPAAAPVPAADVGDHVADEVDAPVMRHGLRLALDALDEEREPGDAVVRAWLGLQAAAEESGVKRRPAETPTEFTTRVIARVGTDDEAARRLVEVYQGVRFGRHPITRGDARIARAAVEALLASWHEPSLRAAR
jgi:hypothetical protein